MGVLELLQYVHSPNPSEGHLLLLDSLILQICLVSNFSDDCRLNAHCITSLWTMCAWYTGLLLVLFFDLVFGFFCFHFLKDLFIICKYTVVVLGHTSRGCQVLLQMVVSHHVAAGIWTQDLRKSSQCSYLLSHLSRLLFLCFESEFLCIDLGVLELTL